MFQPFRLIGLAYTYLFVISGWITLALIPVFLVLIALELILPGNNFPFLWNFDPTDLNAQTGHPYERP